jgi:hypothetical protein
MSINAGDVNGAVVNSNDDATDVCDDGTLDMVTDADGEGDEEVSPWSLFFLCH